MAAVKIESPLCGRVPDLNEVVILKFFMNHFGTVIFHEVFIGFLMKRLAGIDLRIDMRSCYYCN